MNGSTQDYVAVPLAEGSGSKEAGAFREEGERGNKGGGWLEGFVRRVISDTGKRRGEGEGTVY